MKTRKFWSILVVLALVLGSAVSFTSCSDDDDNNKSQALNDYYIEFSVADRGTLTASEASQIAAGLNTIGLEMNGVTYQEASYSFEHFLEGLVDTDEYEFELTLTASLKTGKKTVKTRNIRFSRNGCRLL